MNSGIKIFLLTIIALPVFSSMADRLYGLERLERFDQLPCLLEGTRARQFSSRDRTGGNDDGYNSTYSALYQDENSEYVLFDETVPGCIYRFWITYTSALKMDTTFLCFYFNGENTPRLKVSVGDYFRGTVSPFIYPMIGFRSHSSGGAYSYYPFPYSEGLKVTMTAMPSPFYYNITYHRFDSDEGVETWTTNANVDAGLQMLDSTGIDPKPTNGNVRIEGIASMAGGESFQLLAEAGEGVVQSLKFDFGDLPLQALSDLEISMNWDGGESEVCAPLDEFLMYKAGGIDVKAFPIGMDAQGHAYCFFPMPYWESAEISIRNNTGSVISNLAYEVQISSNSYDQAKTGYFHVDRMQDTFSSDGRDYCYLDVEGRGHFVGMSIYMDGAGTSLSYLEGDERVYVDGSLTPAIQGTGAEDYFNCGWYFYNGEVSLPYHGCLYLQEGNTLAYRLHLTDIIPFEKSIKAGIEHGSDNSSGGTFTSVAYYYLAKNQPSGMMLVADLDLGDAWSESLYGYDLTSATAVSGSWYYEGDNDDILVSDEGYAFTGEIAEFTVPLAEENGGLLLRRRTDQRTAGQKAFVLIDDGYVGTWYEPDANFLGSNKRWLDSEFMVPRALVEGKTSARISIVPLSASSLWNEYHYWAYCIKPYAMTIDVDADGLPDDWELAHATSLDAMDMQTDSDLDGSSDFAEYISGTHPDDPSSRLVLGENISFDTQIGRLYHLEECHDLVANDWYVVRGNIPGTGGIIELPVGTVDSSAPTAFRRLRVEKQ